MFEGVFGVWFNVRFGAGIDIFGGCAELGDILGLSNIREAIAVGEEWRAVEQDQGSTRSEASDQPVPHHPATSGEVEQAVVGLDVCL